MIYAHSDGGPLPAVRPFQFRLRTLLIFVALFCVVACGFGYLFNGIATSLEAENTLQAYRLTLDAVSSYVQKSGEWPKSWDELVSFDSRSGGRLLTYYNGVDDLK